MHTPNESLLHLSLTMDATSLVGDELVAGISVMVKVQEMADEQESAVLGRKAHLVSI